MLGRMQRNWITHTLLMGMYNKMIVTLETFCLFLIKLTWTYCVIQKYTLGHLLQRNKNLCTIKTCTWMFIAILFVIAKYPSTSDYLNIVVCLYHASITIQGTRQEILCSNKKGTSHWYRQQFGWISRALCWIKKKSWAKILHPV